MKTGLLRLMNAMSLWDSSRCMLHFVEASYAFPLSESIGESQNDEILPYYEQSRDMREDIFPYILIFLTIELQNKIEP